MNAPPPSPTAPGSGASRRTIVRAGAVLVLAAVAVYANSFGGPFIFDDLLSIPRNPTIRSLFTALVPPGGGLTVSGRPVLNLSFALNHALSGDHVWSYHALNLLIHLGAGLALFGIVRRTLLNVGRGRSPSPSGLWRAGRTPPHPRLAAFGDVALQNNATGLAFAAALLWLVHPLQTESVTYIVQRSESLMGLFYLLTLYGFIRGAESAADCRAGSPDPASASSRAPVRRDREIPPYKAAGHKVISNAPVARGPRSRVSVIWYALSFVACLLGMGTKEVMVSAPVLVLLYDRTFLAGGFLAAWRRRRPIHLALAATWIPLAILVLHSANRGGTAGFGVGVSFLTYAATQFQAVAHYLWLALWPHPLIVDYGVHWVSTAGTVAPYAVVLVLLVAATVVAFFRWPAFGYLGVWFFAILSPTSLIPGTRQTLAEHRMYLALAPVAVLVVLALHDWLGRRGRYVLAAAVVGLGWLTAQRNLTYRSGAAIWRDTVAKRPGNVFARNNYGNILAEAGHPAAALAQYEAAMRLDPKYADAYYNAGKVLKKLGRLPEALARFEQAVRANPNLPDAQTSLGNALDEVGRVKEAVAHYRQALRVDPHYANAHNSLGLVLAREGRLPDAIAQYEQALKTDPAMADAHNNLGNALRASGRIPEAIAQFEQALHLKPDFAAAHNNLGNAYRQTHRLAEAIAEYEQALKLDPGKPEVHNNLGVSLLMAQRTPEAIAQFEQALRLNPNLGQVHLNLAIALASVGRMQEAEAQLAAARRLGAHLPPMPGRPPGK